MEYSKKQIDQWSKLYARQINEEEYKEVEVAID